jgi:hypothetical protein
VFSAERLTAGWGGIWRFRRENRPVYAACGTRKSVGKGFILSTPPKWLLTAHRRVFAPFFFAFFRSEKVSLDKNPKGKTNGCDPFGNPAQPLKALLQKPRSTAFSRLLHFNAPLPALGQHSSGGTCFSDSLFLQILCLLDQII